MKEKNIKNSKPLKGAKNLTVSEKNRFIKEVSKEVNRNIALRALKELVVGR